MTFSLFDLARSLEARAEASRQKHRLADVQRDPHLARDIGLPYRPRPAVRVDQW